MLFTHFQQLILSLNNIKTANVEGPRRIDGDTFDDVVAHPMQPVAVVQPNGVIVPPIAQPPARPPCVLPNNPNFTTSINGRNGWNFENFYDISEEVRPNIYVYCIYIHRKFPRQR